jgi:hypothetical protein
LLHVLHILHMLHMAVRAFGVRLCAGAGLTQMLDYYAGNSYDDGDTVTPSSRGARSTTIQVRSRNRQQERVRQQHEAEVAKQQQLLKQQQCVKPCVVMGLWRTHFTMPWGPVSPFLAQSAYYQRTLTVSLYTFLCSCRCRFVPQVDPSARLTMEDFQQTRAAATSAVRVPQNVIQLLADLRSYLQEKIEPPVYVSDRRLVKAVALMQVRDVEVYSARFETRVHKAFGFLQWLEAASTASKAANRHRDRL